jgi:hypothetical protein
MAWAKAGNIKGPQGDPGQAGAPGSQIYTDVGIYPSPNQGVEGDYYFSETTKVLFGPRGAAAWPATGISLKGETGDQGQGLSVEGSVTNVEDLPADSVPGNIYFVTSTGDMWISTGVAAAGAAGHQNLGQIQGPQGVAGSTILSGAGAPAADTGKDGDYYLDLSGKTLYGPRTGGPAGAWGSGLSLAGPQGQTGAKGDPGARGNGWFIGAGIPTNVPNAVVGDLYLDTATGDVYNLVS